MDFLTDLLSQEAKIQLHRLVEAHQNRQYDYIRKVLDIDNNLLEDNDSHNDMMYLDNSKMLSTDKSSRQRQDMTSYNNDIITRRIFVDKYTKSVIDMIYISTENIIPESYVIDMILCHWMTNISESILNLKVNLPIPDTSNELPYITIYVSEDIWRRFLKMCDNCNQTAKTDNRILVKDAFKLALFSYIEDMAKKQLIIGL